MSVSLLVNRLLLAVRERLVRRPRRDLGRLGQSLREDGIGGTWRAVVRHLARRPAPDPGGEPRTSVALQAEPVLHPVTPDALEVARSVRGASNPPAIILLGVWVRSGTGFVSNLLGLHPDVHRYPNEMWEIPFLENTDSLLTFSDRFLAGYPYNQGKIGEDDLLALFGSAFIAHMYSHTRPGARALLTRPGVWFLEYFFTVFPHEHLLLLLRDGRDVVTSALATWPNRSFAEECRRWSASTRAILAFCRLHADSDRRFWLGRYEDAERDCEGFVTEVFRHLGLDPSVYPFEQALELPVTGSSTFAEVQRGTWVSRAKTADFSPVGRWQRWSRQERQIFKELAGQALVESGYASDLDW